jgi:hypothetical protein
LVSNFPSGLLISVRKFERSDDRRRGVLQRTVWLGAAADLFPHFPTMDRYERIDLEAESHAAALEFKYRDLEQALEAGSSSDDDGFQSLPRQDQHEGTSMLRPE